MKNKLLTTTAVAAFVGFVGMGSAQATPPAASAFNMTVGGYYKFYTGVKTPIGKVEKQRNYALDMMSDCEVKFRFEGQNSGWRYGAVVELLANPGEALASDASNASRALAHKKSLINADEVYAFADSERFGLFEFGSTDEASEKMAYYAPNKAGSGLIDGVYEDFVGKLSGEKTITGFKALNTDDSLKVNYFMPRYHGVQVGLSYTPNPGREGRRVDFTRILTKKTTGNPLDTIDFKHGTDLSVNYVETFGDVDFALSGSWTHAVPRKISGVSYEDWHSFFIGTNIGYAGWTLGGSFTWDGKSGLFREDVSNPAPGTVRRAAASHDGYGMSVGLQYETGPATLGLAYQYGRGTGNTLGLGVNRKHVISGGATYNLLPGLDAQVELTYRNSKTKEILDDTTVVMGKTKKDWAFLVGGKVTF